MTKLYVNMPVGNDYGWAICGKNTVTELSKITNVRYIPDETYDKVDRDYKTDKFIKEITEYPNGESFNYLQTIVNYGGKLLHKGVKNVGYLFYEEQTIHDELLEHLKQFDLVATGSDWNTDMVRSYGIEAVTIHQGVDTELFKPQERMLFEDKFVIFSGGKLEHRKAQDIVAYVVGKMQSKYDDVILVASWGNIFQDEKVNEANFDSVRNYLVPSQTILMDILPQHEIVKFISGTDIGIFPNRSEGGTNLVMMEYMACGKPVIANNATGQKDVLDKDRGYLIEGTDDELIDQCLASLEDAYKNRDRLKGMGVKAREAMKEYTWEKTAKEFKNLYE